MGMSVIIKKNLNLLNYCQMYGILRVILRLEVQYTSITKLINFGFLNTACIYTTI